MTSRSRSVSASVQPSGGAIAVSIDGNGRRVAVDPYRGAVEAVLECSANLACVGAEPLGLTNCLNFGNPEKPHIAWQLTRAVAGLGDACRALGVPVVGGNVSLYNEGGEGPIYPTPIVGMVGRLPDAAAAPRIGFGEEGHAIALVGPFEPALEGSELEKLRGRLGRGLPPVDLALQAEALVSLRGAVREGRLAFGYVEDLLPPAERSFTRTAAAEETGLEEDLIERIMGLLGTPMALADRLTDQDLEALSEFERILRSGFPLVALLQLVRVYAQSLRRIAEAEVRLFHLFVHEPLIKDGVPALEMAEQMEGLAAELLPRVTPLMEYVHTRYLRFYIEQDVVGHMEAELPIGRVTDRVQVTICFIDLTGFTRYTEEEGDEEALDLVERFVETVEATLPAEAVVVKTIGDEVMIVSPDPATLTEWAVGFLGLFQERPQPRVGVHRGRATYRDGDYFGGEVNLAHRVVARALGGEVMVTAPVVEAIGESDYLEFEPIGHVELKGFGAPAELFTVRVREEAGAAGDSGRSA
jgi:adenylate cyclase